MILHTFVEVLGVLIPFKEHPLTSYDIQIPGGVVAQFQENFLNNEYSLHEYISKLSS